MKNESNKTKKGKNDVGFKEENPIKGIESLPNWFPPHILGSGDSKRKIP